MDNEKPTITLGGKPITIGKPRPSLVASVVTVAIHNETIAQAAALGMCWESGVERAPPAQYRAFKSNPQTYGEAVIDELTKRGVPLAEIVVAGRACLSWFWTMVITAEPAEVAEAVGNSDEAAGTTP